MKPESARWGKHVLLQLAHNAIKVRERALTVIENTLEMLLANQKELTTSVVPSFKSVSKLRNNGDASPLVKSVYQKIIFLVSQPKYIMLWVLKKNISMRWSL